MDQPAALELLLATHEFPCRFLFKAIGRTDGSFAEQVVAVVRAELDHDFDSPFSLKHTAGGRHVSVTIEPWIETAEQVLAVYACIRTVPGLVMLM
ncbi:YbeD family protein [Planctellipticum variicoloris]|uniref:YbeD family protein n=1 Tax=Planctellipticum variicoloris TaxID=3064265 RepID=UPI0030140319|nr:DUF493 domain-containing protein [Planctomycetaceae bacterium SH412]